MPQVVNLPSRGISVNFPDDATPEEIQEALDEYYPRNGADVAHDIATERNFHLKGMSLDDYEMLRGHEGKIAEGKGAWDKTMEATGMLAEDIGSGLKAAYRAAKKGQYGPTLSGSLNVGRDIAVGGLTGTYDLGEVIHGIFEVEDAEDTYNRHLSENDLKDTPEARKDYRSRLANDFKDFKKKMDRADFRQGIIDLAVVPEVAHAASYGLDASVPATFGLGALAKAPAMAATKTAGRTVGQVVGGGFRQAGRAATVVGEVPEKVAGKLLGEGAEVATRGVTTLGGGLGVATGTVIPAMPAAAKAAGAILDVAGDVLESASRAAAEGGRKGTFARSAELAETTAGKNISELLARVETPLSYAGEAIKGAGAGMAIGGTLGGLAEGEEGFWHGIGIGGPLGIGGSLAGRAVGDAFGVRRAALSYDDAKKYLSSHRDARYAIKALDNLSPADAAHLADSVMHMEKLGVKVTFHDDNVPPPALSPEKVARKSYSGVMVDESGVFINTDRVTESTGLHEAFHATAYAMERGKFLGEVQGMLLGKTDPVEGLIVRPGALSMENFAKFVESYAGMMESSAARLRVAGDEIGAAKLEVQSMEFRRKVAEGDLQHAVDEFGAFYWDAFVRGEEPKLFIGGEKDLVVNALNWAKKKASKAFMRDAQKAGLDFSQGTQAAFIRGKQRQFAIPEFDAAIRRFVKNGDMEVTHSVPVTGIPKAQAFALAKLHGAEHLFEVNDKGEPVRVKTIKEIETESKADVEAALDAIEVLPDNVRRSEIVVDEKGRRKLVARNLSNEEKAVLLRTVRHMNNSQRQQLEAFVAGMDSPDGKPVYKVSYWKASGEGRGKRKPYGQFEVSERDALPYSLEMNATGGLYLRFVDMDSVNGNLLKARRLKVYKNLHSSHREAVAEFHSYLENLDSDSPIPSAEFFGGGEVGRLKRNLFYEALGTVPRKDDPPLHNMGREGYTAKRGRNFAFKNFRVERLGNVEDTGVRVKFGESAYERSIVNMLPDESPARFMPDVEGGTPVTPKDALGGKSEPGTVLPAITVISPELAARFMPAVNDPGYHTPEGKMAFPMLADRMKVGTFKTRSGKEYELRGGPDHPDIADNKGVVAWAVEGGPIATQLQTAINKTDGIGLVVLQDEAAVSGNKTFSEIMLDELRYDVANNKKAARSLNKRIKDAALWVRKWAKSKGKKKWLNFKPQNLDDLAAVSPEMSFELRGEVFRKVASIDYKRKTGGIFWRDVMREVTAYQNKDGYRTGDIVKVIQFDKGESIVDPTEVGTPVHPSYRLAVKGRSISNVKGRLSAYQVFRDAFDSMEKEKPGRGITSKGKIGKSAFRSMQMRSLTDPIFREDVGGQTLDVKAYDQPLEFAAKSGPERAEIAKRSEVNQELGARYMPDIGQTDALGMFSAAERATVDLKQEKGGASQMLAMIKKAGVKDEELQALGLDKFLEGNRKVTKDEIIDHLVENQVTVEEVVLGERGATDPIVLAEIKQHEASLEAANAELRSAEGAIAFARKEGRAITPDQATRRDKAGRDMIVATRKIRQLKESTSRETKHASYVEPGAVEGSYRELLLRLPEKEGEVTPLGEPVKIPVDESHVGYGDDFSHVLQYELGDGTLGEIAVKKDGSYYLELVGNAVESTNLSHLEKRLHSFLVEQAPELKLPAPESYTSGHYGEHPNTLAHVRFNDRTSEHGKTLFLEEIQSDWHQEGRKKGYKGGETVAEVQKLAHADREKFYSGKGYESDAQWAALSERVKQWDEREAAAKGTIPDAPFKTSWHELAMKRMISYAAKHGYDAIAWTKGETQAARYDLSKQVEAVHWGRNDFDGSYNLTIEKRGGGFEDMPHSLSTEELPNYVGKEVAEKIVSNPDAGVLRGLDLKVGGEGMKGFYDRMLPRMKTWKKLGLKVETGDVAGHPAIAAKFPAHIVKLTPEVKAKVLDTGIARFMPDTAVPGAERNSIGWAMLLTKSGNWRVYGPDGVLAGVAGSKQRAEQIFKTKYKRELRKREKVK